MQKGRFRSGLDNSDQLNTRSNLGSTGVSLEVAYDVILANSVCVTYFFSSFLQTLFSCYFFPEIISWQGISFNSFYFISNAEIISWQDISRLLI